MFICFKLYLINCSLEEIHLPAHVTFYFQVQSSPKSWLGFGHTDEVTCGGNALKFYAVDDNNRLLKIEDKVNLLLLLIIRSVNKLARSYKVQNHGNVLDIWMMSSVVTDLGVHMQVEALAASLRSWSWLVNMESSSNKTETTS
ncbi:hypothetical protein CFP56_020619 [Quercus suber]|uniref:Uncharacterized protein n=1 Tax=Quercus suber TaxID=58331 RepID=A0AAW0KHL8_QUESU